VRSGLRLTLAFLALAARVAPEEPTVTAALIGDGGKGTEDQRALARQILDRRPQALFLLGDNL
jgi:hypothetical protein